MRARDFRLIALTGPGVTAPRARVPVAGTGTLLPLERSLRHYPLTSPAPVRTEQLVEAREPTPVPSLHRRHTRRPRLTRLLDASLAQAIIVTAPAGYGKTSLACEWLADRTDVAWYRATSASADLAAFSVGIADVAAPLVPGAGDRLRQRLRVAEAPEKAVRPLAELLAEDLAEWPDGAWLVIDDYHLVIDSSPVEEFMDWLLTLAPIRLLVTTRRRPAWASARRVLYGEVSEITKEQLAMTNDEAARVLDGRPSETVRALVVQAQGWPALIGLAALSATAEIPSERVSEGLFRYFAEEVFRREPAELQRFMLVASVPQTVNATIARETLAVDEPDALLERLLDEGFLQESGPGEYAFHPLLRDFLRRKLESELPELAVSLADKATAYARASGRWEEAFDLAIYRGKYDDAAEIIGEASPSLLAAGRTETIEKWLSVFGPSMLLHPEALLAKAEVLMRQGRFSEALALARDVGSQLDTEDLRASRSWCLAGQAAHFVGKDEDALQFHLKARDMAKDDGDLTSALWGTILVAADLELEDVERYLDELATVSTGDIDSRLRIANGRATAARARGSLAGIAPIFEALLPFAEYASDPMIKSSFFVHLSYLNSLRARYVAARGFALQANAICVQLRSSFSAVLCDLTRAYAEIGLRQVPETRRILATASKYLSQFDDPFLQAAISTLTVKHALAAGDLRTALRPTIYPRDHTPPKSVQGELHALIALAAAAAGEATRAADEISAARALTTSAEATYLARFAEVITALRSEPEEPLLRQEVTSLLLDAASAGVLDTFVSAYRAYPALLSLLDGNHEVLALVATTLTSANDQTIADKLRIELPMQNPSQLAGGALTKREAEVLGLMCEGLSNAEIGQRLFIAPSTVKVHVHAILHKLGVRTRLHAVLQACDFMNAPGGS